MDKQNSYEKYNKRKKVKKIKYSIIIIVVLSIIVLYFGYKYYALSLDNVNMKLENNCTSSTEEQIGTVIKGFTEGLIENNKYSIFVKFLIFLGILYLIQIGLSAVLDIVELIAFGIVSIRGVTRIPNKIKSYFERRKKIKCLKN
jgi:hypothetical protein